MVCIFVFELKKTINANHMSPSYWISIALPKSWRSDDGGKILKFNMMGVAATSAWRHKLEFDLIIASLRRRKHRVQGAKANVVVLDAFCLRRRRTFVFALRSHWEKTETEAAKAVAARFLFLHLVSIYFRTNGGGHLGGYEMAAVHTVLPFLRWNLSLQSLRPHLEALIHSEALSVRGPATKIRLNNSDDALIDAARSSLVGIGWGYRSVLGASI